MWILPEEVRARQAVMEGIGRAVRELYKVQHFEVVSHSMRKLLEARSRVGAFKDNDGYKRASTEYRAATMTDQKNHTYEKQARDYEQKAKLVSDPWLKEKYVTLAKRCREMRKAPKSDETDFHAARSARSR